MRALVAAVFVALLAGTSVFAQDLPACRVGLHVDRAGALNYPATIDGFDPAVGAYHVKYDNGGIPGWLLSDQIKRGCTGVPRPPITVNHFVGNWEMFVGPAPQYEIRGGDRWLVVGPGAVAPPLSIKADGTYSWAIGRGQVINGRWRPMAQGEMKYGYTNKLGIMLLQGYDGADWQVTQAGIRDDDKRPQLDIQQMKYGISYLATRMRAQK